MQELSKWFNPFTRKRNYIYTYMFENAINSKKQGDIGMCYAMAYFSKAGYTVCIPITDSQDYDLIIDNGTKLYKVQVKTTKFKYKDRIYAASIKTCGGNRSGQTIKNFNDNSSDLLFILTDEGTMYLIPREYITTDTYVYLTEKFDTYKVFL